MKRFLLIYCFLFSVCFAINAQRVFTPFDVQNSPAFSVSDMLPDEIKAYNDWVKNGDSDTLAISIINAGRAWDNLKQAPATIIQLLYNSKVNQGDSLPQYLGAQKVWFEIINSTTKTIKNISITVEFIDSIGRKLYDTKTGRGFMSISFNNLAGRCSSSLYNDIFNSILDCDHVLDMSEAITCSPFYNDNCNRCFVSSVSIVYEDGTKSKIFSSFSGETLYFEGPLKPYTVYCRRILKE